MSERSPDREFTRRTFLKRASVAVGAAAAAPTLLSACTSTTTPAPAATEAPAGGAAVATPTVLVKTPPTKVIRILALNWPQTPTEQTLANEDFTAKTGIEVQIEGTDYTFLEQRVKQLVGGKSDEYDIYHYDSQWIGGFVAAGALERLDTDQFLDNPDSAIKADDFFPELWYRLGKYPTDIVALESGDFETAAKAPTYGFPWSLNCQALWYRKDLISTPPTSWEELRDMAKTLTRDGMYGMAFEGSRAGDYISVDLCPILWSNGGQLWDPANWQADGFINGPKSVEALQFMRDMVAVDKSVDPASGNWTINERLAAILQGKTAMALNWVPLFGGIAEDPASSGVVGKIGLTVSPAGNAGQFAMYGCQGTGINAYSRNKDAAWQYLQWLLSKETQQKMVETPAAGFISARKDLKDVHPQPWQEVFLQSVPVIRDFWNMSCYAELLDILQREANLAYIGRKEPQTALDDAATAHQVVYDECKVREQELQKTAALRLTRVFS